MNPQNIVGLAQEIALLLPVVAAAGVLREAREQGNTIVEAKAWTELCTALDAIDKHMKAQR